MYKPEQSNKTQNKNNKNVRIQQSDCVHCQGTWLQQKGIDDASSWILAGVFPAQISKAIGNWSSAEISRYKQSEALTIILSSFSSFLNTQNHKTKHLRHYCKVKISLSVFSFFSDVICALSLKPAHWQSHDRSKLCSYRQLLL